MAHTYTVRSINFPCRNAVFTSKKFNNNLFGAIMQYVRWYVRRSPSLQQTEPYTGKWCSSSNPPAHELAFIFFLSSTSFSFSTQRNVMHSYPCFVTSV